MSSLQKGLYLVATPIGNLGDISARAIEVLSNADIVACEDTRVSGKLFSLLNIPTPKLFSYHDHNEAKSLPLLLSKLKEGGLVALISDAGTPLINDPGYKIVQECFKNDIYVTAIPGASAVLTALQLSGLPSDRFLFAGFLPNKTTQRKKEIEALKNIPATILFYESPQRLLDSLSDLKTVLSDRQVAVCRELTKKFEQVKRGSLSELIAYYEQNGSPKGEIVIVVGKDENESIVSDKDLEKLLKNALKTMTLKESVAFISEQTNVNKNKVYQKALEIKNAQN